MKIQHRQEIPFPLFKGATRVPIVVGVPMMPLLWMLIAVAILAMTLTLWCWFLALPLWFVMAQITKNDDRAFRIWALWIDTKWRNGHKAFWGASTYSKCDYRAKNRR